MTTLNVPGIVGSGMFPTSGTWTFSVTRDHIIRDAMLNLGLLEESEVPTAAEITDCARRLNMIVKQLAGNLDKAPGFKMYQRQRADLFLGYSQYQYDLGYTGDNWAAATTGLMFPTLFNSTTLTSGANIGNTSLVVAQNSGVNLGDYLGVVCGSDIFWTTAVATPGSTGVTIASALPVAAAGGAYVYNYTTKAQRPMKILTALLRNPQGTDTPLTEMTLQQYEALPTKVQPGFVQDPTAFYYEAQMANNLGSFFIDCAGAQDVTKIIHVVYLRESMDFNNPGDAPEFPQEWYLHLVWSLALQICPMFDADWTADRQAAYSVAVQPAREGVPEISADYFQPHDPDGF